MDQIPILYEWPLILTKDVEFVKSLKDFKPNRGVVIALPEDAIVVCFPQSQQADKINKTPTE